jgi:hypothetical protein
MRLLAVVVSGLGLFVSTSAHATLIFGWDFAPSEVTVTNTDSIVISATLTNSLASDENLTIVPTGAGLAGASDVTAEYQFYFGPLDDGNSSDLFAQFTGLDLAPGESVNFVFGGLTPLGGFVPDGTYDIASGSLNFPGVGGVNSDSAYTIHVPETSVTTLFAGALGVLIALRGRVRRG